MKHSEAHSWKIYISAFLGMIAVCWIVRQNHPFGVEFWSFPSWTKEYVFLPLERYVGGWSLLAIGIYPFAVLGILLLERLVPAIPEQKTLSVGLVHDAVWLLVGSILQLLIVVWYVKLLKFLYAHYLGFLTVASVEDLPEWSRLVLSVLLLDFLRWLTHYLHHKIPWLWYFHAVHHSQRELNMFTDYRLHFVDFFLYHTLAILPLMMFSVSAPNIIAFSLFRKWHARLYHSNVKSNFGPLRYLLVTPQSHRVHHSLKAAHRDMNYGSLLSVWDYLFHTQHRKYDEYPETGIADESFPLEVSPSIRSILITPLLQIIYPFRQVGKRFRARDQ